MNDNRDSLAAQQAAGLRKLADMIENNPELASAAAYLDGLNVFFAWTKDDVQAVIRAGLATGAKVEKTYRDGNFTASLTWGPVTVKMLSERKTVCEKVVTTREVTEEVPDPEALAAVPTVTQTRTVEDVQWVCLPVLAAGTEPAVA